MRRLTILIAALGALMLVPAAQALAAAPEATVIPVGEGSGEVFSGYEGNREALPGEPPIECAYDGSTETASGVCANEMPELEEGLWVEFLNAVPAEGSKIVEWAIESGTAFGACEAPNLSECWVASFSEAEPVVVYAVFECSGAAPCPPPPEEFALSVSKTGEGTGTVTSSPAGINCGSECSAEFPAGEEVTLTATAGEGSEFTGWSGSGCSGTGTCVVTMSEAKEVTANFDEEGPAGPPLTLNIEEGEGTVVSNPAGLSCSGLAPHSCTTESIAEGSVTLTASPAPGYLFKGWKKCDTGGVNGRQCTINLNAAKEVGAKFIPVFSLDATKSNPNGIFSTSPAGVNCGYGCNSSSALYKEGSVTLKAKAAKNFHFVEFTGGTGSAASCNGVTALECTITTFNSNSAIEEVYAENAKNSLTLTKEGGGQGLVKTKPTNINCTYTCTEAEGEFFATETAVPVTVTLGKGTSSVTWVSGAGTCTANAVSCTVDMSSAHSLVAKFE